MQKGDTVTTFWVPPAQGVEPVSSAGSTVLLILRNLAGQDTYGGTAVPHHYSEAVIARLFNAATTRGVGDAQHVFNQRPEDVPLADAIRLAARCGLDYSAAFANLPIASSTTSAGSSLSAVQMDKNSPM